MSQETDATRPDAITQRIIREEAMRHAAEEGGTTTLEAILARISAEVTKQAARKRKDDKDASR